MVKLYQVAKEAKCSIPTVSKVLNGRTAEGRISPEIAMRVRVAAKKLGYKRLVNKVSADTFLFNFLEWAIMNKMITTSLSPDFLISIYHKETDINE